MFFAFPLHIFVYYIRESLSTKIISSNATLYQILLVEMERKAFLSATVRILRQEILYVIQKETRTMT